MTGPRRKLDPAEFQQLERAALRRVLAANGIDGTHIEALEEAIGLVGVEHHEVALSLFRLRQALTGQAGPAEE